MTLKKLFIAVGLIAASTMSASATDIIVDTNSNGTAGASSYIGRDYANNSVDSIGGPNFNIYNMVVSRVGGMLTVKINTNYAGVNNTSWHGNKYYMGDLFMSTTGWKPKGSSANGYKADNALNTGTKWNYVYDLNGARGLKANQTNLSQAKLHKLKNYNMTKWQHQNRFEYGNTRGNYDHLYRANNTAYASTIGGGSVEISKNNSYLQFVFDVSGTELATATQIAFHWTQSCANDIIEGVVDFASEVPEPAALGLLLLGLGGVGFARRRKQTA